MKNRRRNKEAFAEHSYWQSYSDMMAALLLIFILIIAITLAIYREKTNDLDKTRLELSEAQSQLDATIEDLEQSKAELEQSNGELASSLAELQQAYEQAALTQEELNNAYLEIENARQELTTTKQELQDIVGIRTDIIGALQSAFSNSSMKVDAQTGSITFSSDVLFRYNSSYLTAESKESLKNIIPMYLDVLLQDQFREYIAEIIIEGHTDTDGSYQSNMDVSYKNLDVYKRQIWSCPMRVPMRWRNFVWIKETALPRRKSNSSRRFLPLMENRGAIRFIKRIPSEIQRRKWI